MKKLTIFSSIAAAALAMVGCQEKEIETFQPGNEGSTFELIAEIAQTKTTLDADYKVAWEEGDIIYMVTSDGTWGVPYAEDNTTKSIATFTYSGGKFTTPATIAEGDYTFNAVYSNGEQMSYHRSDVTTNQLYATQTQDCDAPTAHIKAYDALVGTFTANIPSDEPATVNMNHIYTLMQVNVTNDTGAAIDVTSFQMTAADADLAGIFSVKAFDTPAIAIKSGASESITVNVTGGTVADGGSLPVYFVMAPLADYSGDVTFKVTDSEGNTYSKTVTMNGISFEAGTYNKTPYTISTADPKVQLANPLTSNVFVYLGDNSYKETANVNGISDVTTYKVGKSGAPGLASIVLPAGTSKIGFYAVSWKDKAAEFVIKSGEDEIAAFNPSANEGASNSSPYTMEVSDEDYYEFVFPETLGQESEYTLTTKGTNYRVIFWGINYYTTSGIGENQVERSISPTIYCNNNTVTIIAADGAKIYYTCDGSTPSESSALYAAPFEIDATTTVKAIAIEDDKPRSKVVSMNCVYADPNAGGGESEGSNQQIVLSEQFDDSTTSDSSTAISVTKFPNFSGETAKAYTSKYGGLKLGTGSAVGYITSKSLDLSSSFTVKIDACKYGSDTGNIVVTVGEQSQTIQNTNLGAAGTFKTFTLTFNAATATSTVKIATSSKRAYIDNIVITKN